LLDTHRAASEWGALAGNHRRGVRAGVRLAHVRRAWLACRALAALGIGMVTVAGCGGEPPRPAPPVPTFSATPSTAAPSTTAPPTRTLPADCGSLLPAGQIDLVLGRPLVGRIQAITGVAEPKIKRLERLTCRYGLPDGPLPPDAPIPLEVSVSRYADEASATERITDTVESERARGAAPSSVPAGPVQGTVLITPDRRLLVAANGPLTLAISVAPGVADDRLNAVMSELGGRVLTTVS